MKKPDFFSVYETFNNLYGYTLPKEELMKLIQEAPLGGVMNILSQFTALPTESKKIKNQFNSFLESNYPHKRKSKPNIETNMIYSEQGLLTVWKWMLAYGNEEQIDKEITIESGINFVLFINLIVSDLLYDTRINEKNIKYELFANAVFNTKSEFGSSLVRSIYIFNDISNNPEYFQLNDYIDIHTPFKHKYGYSIKEYLSVILALLTGFMKKKNEGISASWTRSYDYFHESPLANIADKIIDELAMDFNEAKEWTLRTINAPWDYTKFRQKPILKLNNDNFFPINFDFLYEKIFSQLYFKIREVFPSNNTQVISFYGKCFEKYVEILTEQATTSSRLPYVFVPEFPYSKSTKRSPDALIRLDNSILVIEAKVYRLKMDSIIGGVDSSEIIEEDINKMSVDPIKQIHDRISELIEQDHEQLKGIEKFYFISVTFGTFPTLKPFELQIEDQLQNYFKIPVAYHFHLDIEEYELLMELISRPNAKPVFRYLETKNRNELTKYMSFKNYLLNGSFRPRRSKHIQDYLTGILDEITELVSP